MKISFVLLLTFIGFKLTRSQVCVFETNIDYVGSPNANDIGSVSSSDASNCCLQCSSQPIARCAAWTFINGICYFKSNFGVRTFSVGSNKNIHIMNILYDF
jgi:hypothetical protein